MLIPGLFSWEWTPLSERRRHFNLWKNNHWSDEQAHSGKKTSTQPQIFLHRYISYLCILDIGKKLNIYFLKKNKRKLLFLNSCSESNMFCFAYTLTKVPKSYSSIASSVLDRLHSQHDSEVSEGNGQEIIVAALPVVFMLPWVSHCSPTEQWEERSMSKN